MWFVYYPVISLGSIPKHGITKLKDKHIFKTSDSYCQIPHHKTSDKAHLHHWQEKRRAGVTNQRARSRMQGTPAAAQWLRHCTATAGGTDSNPGQGPNVPPGAATEKRKKRGQEAKKTNLRAKVGHWRESVSNPARPFCKHQRRLRAQGEGVTRSSRPPTSNTKPRAHAAGHHGVPAPPDQRWWGWRSRTGHGATTTDGLSFWFSKEKNRVRCEFLRHRLRVVLIGFPK